MKLGHDGLTLWYETVDAPAPAGSGASRRGTSLTVAVKPPSPLNAVNVRYRVDGGKPSTLALPEVSIDYARNVQYFRAQFPPMPVGKLVEYVPLLTCGGRQVPAPSAAGRYFSQFTLADPTPMTASPLAPAPALSGAPRFAPCLDFVASVHAKFAHSADVIGETPIGLRVNYYLASGDVVGPRLKGRVLQGGGDFLLIRRDGVGAVQVEATFQTEDGAIVGAEYYGIVDMGPDGYERAIRGQFPDSATLQLAPRFLTGHPRYAWMNRPQFLGVGEVRPSEETVDYDLFMVSNKLVSGI